MQKTKFKCEDLTEMLSENSLVIFLFHGVINKQKDLVRNYTNKHLEKDFFADVIKSLSTKGTSLSMDNILYHLKNNLPFPKFSYSITFDDGFENNLSIAAPILDNYKTHAIIYITINFIDKNIMSWIDRIESAIQNFKLKKLYWSGINYSLESKQKKINFLQEIRSKVKNDFRINPDLFADELCDKLDYNVYSQNDELDLKLNWDQVKIAHDSEYLLIGGHSHSHKILSFLNEKDLKEEIELSIGLLKSKGQIETIHYSYPEGLSNCYNERVIFELKNKGVQCCPTAIYGVNEINCSPFHLKRVQVI